jgi:hypothetical protein
VRPKELAAAGVERVPRTVGVRDGSPMLENGRVMDVATVLWCTGFRPDFTWIDLPVFDQDGSPAHHRGVVGSQPGLYFVGLWFLSAFTSSLLGGVGNDAEYIAEQIASHRHDGQRRAAARHQSGGSPGPDRPWSPKHPPPSRSPISANKTVLYRMIGAAVGRAHGARPQVWPSCRGWYGDAGAVAGG